MAEANDSLLSSQDVNSETGGNDGSTPNENQSKDVWGPLKKDVRETLGDDFLKGYEGVSDLVLKGAKAIQDSSKDSIVKPGESATDEEKKAYVDSLYKELGKPESSDKYDFKEIQDQLKASGLDGDKDLLAKLKTGGFEIGLSNSQLNKVAAMMAETQIASIGVIEEAIATQKAESTVALKAEWGDDFAKNLKQVTRMVKNLGGEDFLKTLDTTQFANDKNFILPMFELSKKFADPAFDGGESGKAPDNSGMLKFPNTQYPKLV